MHYFHLQELESLIGLPPVIFLFLGLIVDFRMSCYFFNFLIGSLLIVLVSGEIDA